MVGDLAGSMSLVVPNCMGICQSMIWDDCGCEDAELTTLWEVCKFITQKVSCIDVPHEYTSIQVFYENRSRNKPLDFGTQAAPAVLFQPIFWDQTSDGAVNQASLCICITETVVKINGWGLNWEGRVGNGPAVLCCLLIISQAPLASIKENKRI